MLLWRKSVWYLRAFKREIRQKPQKEIAAEQRF